MAKFSRKERRLLRQTGRLSPILPKAFTHRQEDSEERRGKPAKYNRIQQFYIDKYKPLLILTFAILAIAIISIGVKYATTGDFMNRGISLKGGISITFTEEKISFQEMQLLISENFAGKDINLRMLSELGVQKGFIIESSDVSEKDILDALEKKIPGIRDNYSVEIIGSTLGGSFFKQTGYAMLIAFISMSLVVFYFFRSPGPSLAVILCAFSDIITTLAIVNITGMKISSAGIASFLMLIGYSVDTDILLSTYMVKRKEGTLMERVFRAWKTGITMTITTLAALTVGLLFTQSEVIREIMIILLIGLIVDIMYTWIQNAGLLRLYLERKK